MKAVGARLPRYDGVAHVTGRTQYVDDVRVHGTLWCKALRSPHHSARIRLDRHEPRPRAMPGVHAIVTHEDVPHNVYGHLEAPRRPGRRAAAGRRTTCAGRASRSRAVAAESEDARAGRGRRDRGRVRGARAGPRHPHRRRPRRAASTSTSGAPIYPHFGPHNHRRVRKGDVEAAFDAADLIVEGVYRPQAIEHAPMETQVSLVVPEPSGRLTIYSCTQAMYFSMGVVAAHLQWPLNKLKFVGGTVGGGFGGKVDTATETICALLAIKAQRPGQVALHPRGGVPDLLDARAVAHRDPRRGDRATAGSSAGAR